MSNISCEIPFEIVYAQAKSNTTAAQPGGHKLYLDDGWFAGSAVTFYWEVVATNSDSVARDIELTEDDGTNVATVSVPASTSAVTRLTRVAFTPVSGGNLYRIKLEGTTSNNQLTVFNGRIIIKIENASKLAVSIMQGNRANYSDTQWTYEGDSGGSYSEDPQAGLGQYMANWIFESDWFAGTSVTYDFQCQIYNNLNSRDSGVRLYNKDDSTVVTSSTMTTGVVAVGMYSVRCQPEFAAGDDGDIITVQVMRNGTGTSYFYTCNLIAIITAPTSVPVYWDLGRNEGGNFFDTEVITARRARINKSAYSGDSVEAFLEGCIWDQASGESRKATLEDEGTTDSGESGSDISTELDALQAAAKYDVIRSADMYSELDDGDRYCMAGGSGTGQIKFSNFYLIILLAGSPFDEELEAQDDFTLGDYAEIGPVWPVQVLEMVTPDGFTLAEYPEKPEDLPYELLEAQDDFTMTDEGEIDQPTGVQVLEVQDDFVLGEAVEFDRGEAYSAKTLVLAGMYIDQGIQWLAGKPIRHPSRYYEGRVKTWGRVTRSIPIPSGMLHTGDATVEIDDTEGIFRQLFAAIPPQNREMILKVGPEGGKEHLFYVAYTGIIKTASFPPGLVRVVLRDKIFAFLDEDLPDLLTRREWVPGAEGGGGSSDRFFARNLRKRSEGKWEEEEVFSPIVFGQVVAFGTDTIGAMNAIRIDDVTFNLSQTRIPWGNIAIYGKASDADDFSELTSGFSIEEEEKTIGERDYIFTHVVFDSEKEDGYEVRWDGEGMPEPGQSEETPARNPAVCIRLYLTEIVGKDESEDLDLGSFRDAAEIYDAIETGNPAGPGLKFDGAIVRKMKHSAVLAQMQTSFNCEIFTDKWGKIAIKYLGDEPSIMPSLDDVQDIYLKSETHFLASPVYNILDWKANRMYSTQEWNIEEEHRNVDAIASYGKEERKELPLWFVRDPFTATSIIYEYLSWVSPEVFRIMFSTPGHRRIPEIDLMKYFEITNYSGLDESGGGYVDRRFVVNKTVFDLDKKNLEIHAVTRLQPVAGQGALEGSVAYDARYGPFYGGPGKFTGIFRDHDNFKKLRAMYSIDWGQHFTEADPDNSPTYTESIVAYDAIEDRQNARRLLVVTQVDGTGAVDLHIFNTATGEWEQTKIPVWAGTSGWDASHPMAQVDRTRLSGRIGVFFSRDDDEQASGESWAWVGRTSFTYSDDDGSSWSTPSDVGAETTAQSKWGEKYDYKGGRIVAGREDRFHFFYNRYPGTFVRSTEDEFHRTAMNSGSLSPEVKWLVSGLSWYPAEYNYGWPESYQDPEDSLGIRVRVQLKGSFDARYIDLVSEDVMEETVNRVQTFHSGLIVFQGGGAHGNTGAVTAQVQLDPVTNSFHFFQGCIRGIASQDAAVIHKQPGDTIYDLADEELDAYRIGPKYSTLMPQESSAKILNLVGQNWIAAFQDSVNNDYDFYFTFWPSSWVPRPNEFDTDAIHALIDYP